MNILVVAEQVINRLSWLVRIQGLASREPRIGRAPVQAFVILGTLLFGIAGGGLWCAASAADEAGQSKGQGQKQSATADPNARRTTRPAEENDPSLDVVIATHVLLWRDEIMTWEQITARLRALREQKGKPVYPRYRLTRGALKAGRWAEYEAQGLALYKELSAPAPLPPRRLLCLAPDRYDLVRTAADLTPVPEQMRS